MTATEVHEIVLPHAVYMLEKEVIVTASVLREPVAETYSARYANREGPV